MRVRLTLAAEFELTDAVNWYEGQASGLGGRFLNEFKVLVERIGQNPRQFPIVYRNARRASLNRFPYGLFFRIRRNDVKVFACFHFSRDPVQWQRRS